MSELFITLGGAVPAYKQVLDQLRLLMQTGELTAGQTLPGAPWQLILVFTTTPSLRHTERLRRKAYWFSHTVAEPRLFQFLHRQRL